MNYNVVVSENFKRDAKRLKKRFISLNADIDELITSLEINPEQGKALGDNCYKIRLAISSKGKGKRAGARVITYVRVIDTTVYLLSVYDKGQKETVTDQEIKQMLNELS